MLGQVECDFRRGLVREILRRARRALSPDGVLILGSAETTVMVDDGWDRLVTAGSVAYRPQPARAGAVAVPA